jgi:hypothetical protein
MIFEGLFPPAMVVFPSNPNKKYVLCGGKAHEVPMDMKLSDAHKYWVKKKFKERCLYETNIPALRGSGLYNVRYMEYGKTKKWTCTCSKGRGCNHVKIAEKEYNNI